MDKETAKEVRRFLSFIRDTHITRAEWRRNGKAAYGKPELWNEYRLTGPSGQITISSDVQKICRPLVQVGPIRGSMYALSDAGSEFLRESS